MGGAGELQNSCSGLLRHRREKKQWPERKGGPLNGICVGFGVMFF